MIIRQQGPHLHFFRKDGWTRSSVNSLLPNIRHSYISLVVPRYYDKKKDILGEWFYCDDVGEFLDCDFYIIYHTGVSVDTKWHTIIPLNDTL